MKNISLLYCIALLFVSGTNSLAQDSLQLALFPDIRKGAIVIILHDRQYQLSMLESRGYKEEAQERRESQRKENLNIRAGALKSFNFCKLYYIFQNDTGKFRSGIRQGIFLNDSLEYDSSIVMTEKDYIFGEILAHAPFVSESPANNGSNEPLQTTVSDVEMLGFRDKNMEFLKGPFPWYIRTNRTFTLLKKPFSEVFGQAQMKLEEWYSNPSRRTLRKLEKLSPGN